MRLAAAPFVASAMLMLLAPAGARAENEYEVKAAILYNIARFVEWPGEGRGGVTLCVLGRDPFGAGMDALAGRPVGEGALQIRRIGHPREAHGCQVVFIAASEAPHVRAVLAGLPQPQTLTAGDTPGFAEAGVAVNLFLDNGRVRFEINLDAAHRSGLTISSQLLKLARITHDGT